MNKEQREHISEESLRAAMRAFERYSAVLRYREKDGWHACDIIGMREAIGAALAVLFPSQHDPKGAPCPTCGFYVRERKRRPLLIEEHYTGVAVCGPFDGCEIEADGPSVPDEQGGQYNYVAGQWSWVPGPGTQLHVALSRSGGAGGAS